ncbi:DUF4267 domain-containing protein [Actinacidiphila bryophytorum]|uniref:DUF4267 domain-containing protein n=1 Tax=Actinacidiphila bryophytorum TaxID=1436133 RepID=UPI002176AFD0|nr:DUF4267 domain-containing protein [Actinacidiphila bryophytorum]UWE11328.1 DUF4267 domain-containing protein [Actinacidiphila bryophytorum]
MLTTIATVISWVIGGAIALLGTLDLAKPQAAAAGFGLPNGSAAGESATSQAWMYTRAVRDIASGLFIFVLLANGEKHVLGWVMLAACLIPLGDAIVVHRNNGPSTSVYGVHGGSGVLMLATSFALLAA